jgi:hypothetical protein
MDDWGDHARQIGRENWLARRRRQIVVCYRGSLTLILFLALEKWVVARATKGENEGAALLDPGRARLFIWEGGRSDLVARRVASPSLAILYSS